MGRTSLGKEEWSHRAVRELGLRARFLPQAVMHLGDFRESWVLDTDTRDSSQTPNRQDVRLVAIEKRRKWVSPRGRGEGGLFKSLFASNRRRHHVTIFVNTRIHRHT